MSMGDRKSVVTVLGLAHIGIRVHELERSVRFYELLGFVKTAGPIGPEPVAILEHPSGLEVNLVLNAPSAAEANILMDVPDKHAGITHFALLFDDIPSTLRPADQTQFPSFAAAVSAPGVRVHRSRSVSWLSRRFCMTPVTQAGYASRSWRSSRSNVLARMRRRSRRKNSSHAKAKL